MKTYSVKENISFDQNKVSKFCSQRSLFHSRVEYVAFANWTTLFEFVDYNFSAIGFFDLLASSRGHIFQESGYMKMKDLVELLNCRK